MNLILSNATVCTPWEVLEKAGVEISDGYVRRVVSGGALEGEDLEEMILAPGFIDTHLHGYAGIDVTFASAEELLELAALLPQIGVTAFLPTVLTACHEDFVRACETIALAKRLQGEYLNGARILGVNLEGPCLNPERIGAQNSRWVRPPNRQEFEEYWRASKGGIRIVTLAPELPGAHELISRLTELGVVVSIGHTNASYEEAKAAIAAGARRATHLFNAMTPIHHRKPGAVIACLEASNVYLEIIADLVHVAGPLVRLVWQLVGTGRIVAITDAIAAAGLPDGTYTLADQPMRVEGGVARLEDGRLAGSTLPLAKNVQNLVALGVPIPDALAMASSVPARSIGLPDMGTIFPGALADLVVLDHDLRVKRTYIAGKLVFAADP